MSCVNCNTDFDSEFCPNCGEKRVVPRINLISLVNHFYCSFLDMDKGFLFNLKNLTLQPRETVLAYLSGSRRKFLNPISYTIITISIYIILTALIKEYKSTTLTEELAERIQNMSKIEEIGYNTGKIIFEQLKFFWILMTFCLSAFTRLIFKRFNFFEHLAINFFVVGHSTILAILVKAFYHKEILIFNFLVFIYMTFLIYKIFRNKKEQAFSITMSIMSVFFAYLMFFTIPLLVILYS